MVEGKLKNVSYISNFVSKYQRGLEMTYEIDGQVHTGEFNVKMGSVAILLFDTDLQQFLLVRQFRPAMFTSTILKNKENYGKDYSDIKWEEYDTECGYTMELCAGLIDKEGLTPEQIAFEEVEEECGYKVDKLTPIATFIVGSHQSGNAQYLFYAEIDSSKKISEGGGNVHEGEVITKVYITLEQARHYVYASENNEYADINGPPGVLFAFQWWFLKDRLKMLENSNFNWIPRPVKSVSNIRFSSEFDKTKYGYNPKRMIFTINGIKRTWDLALCPSSAAAILIDSEKRELILLELQRVQVLVGKLRNAKENIGKSLESIDFTNANPLEGVTLELVTAKVPDFEDPQINLKKHLETIGYKDVKNLKLIAKVVPGIGQSGDTQHIFLVDVKNSQNQNETRIPFSALPSLFKQNLIGPPNVYYAIGFVIDQVNRNRL